MYNGHCGNGPSAALGCHCEQNTEGICCSQCKSAFRQKEWKPNTKDQPFECECKSRRLPLPDTMSFYKINFILIITAWNCDGHSDRCIYDEEIDRKRLSMNIHGEYECGGVCQDCEHNTTGINCNECKAGCYRSCKTSRSMFVNVSRTTQLKTNRISLLSLFFLLYIACNCDAFF